MLCSTVQFNANQMKPISKGINIYKNKHLNAGYLRDSEPNVIQTWKTSDNKDEMYQSLIYFIIIYHRKVILFYYECVSNQITATHLETANCIEEFSLKSKISYRYHSFLKSFICLILIPLRYMIIERLTVIVFKALSPTDKRITRYYYK